MNEEHLRRLVRDYVSRYHGDRIHDSLEKDTPNRRPVERKVSAKAVLNSEGGSAAFIIGTAGGMQHSNDCGFGLPTDNRESGDPWLKLEITVANGCGNAVWSNYVGC